MSPRSTSAFHASSDSWPTLVEADHHLQLGAVALLQCREAQLSGVAGEHHPAGDADDVAGLGVGRQVGIGLRGSRRGCGCAAPRPGTARGPRRAAARAWPDGSGTARGRRTRSRADQERSRRASLNEHMAGPINAAAVAALADEVIDWRFKGLPASWWGRTTAQQICAGRHPDLFDERRRASARSVCCAPRRSRTTWPRWPAGAASAASSWRRTARRTWRRSCSPGSSTRARARSRWRPSARSAPTAPSACATSCWPTSWSMRPDCAGWPPNWTPTRTSSLMCWVDSVRGVELMTAALTAAGADRPVDVCVEVGMPGGRTGCRGRCRGRRGGARGRGASPQLRLVGVAGYEAALGHDIAPDALAGVSDYLPEMRVGRGAAGPAVRDGPRHRDRGRQHVLRRGRRRADRRLARGLAVRTIVRSGATSPTTTGCTRRTSPLRAALLPALEVWARWCRVRSRAGSADDGPPRRVVRPGSAGAAAGLPTASSPSSTISTRICGWARATASRSAAGSGSASRIRARCSTSGS